MNKVYYPAPDFFSDEGTSPVWYQYLLNGFQMIDNVEVELSDELSKQSFNINENSIAKHLTAIDVQVEGKRHRVWYDWSDFSAYHSDVRKDGDFYFKVHFTKDLYNKPRVYPIGQTVGNMTYLRNLERLRKMTERDNYDVTAIFRTTSYDVRLKAVELLSESNLKTRVGLKDFNPGKIRPYAPEKFRETTLMPYLKHQEILAQSKFILALPGVNLSRSWRHAEGWGLGVPLIALDLPSQNPGNYQDCYIKVKDDLSNLIEKIEYYKANYGEALAIAEKGKQYYEKWLSPKAQAENIIKTIQKETNEKVN